MKIQFRQSGGFAGLTRSCKLDTASMSPADAGQLESMARASTKSPGVSTTGADMICYEIEITDGGRKRKLIVDDMTLTAELAPLVEYLTQQAKPQAPS